MNTDQHLVLTLPNELVADLPSWLGSAGLEVQVLEGPEQCNGGWRLAAHGSHVRLEAATGPSRSLCRTVLLTARGLAAAATMKNIARILVERGAWRGSHGEAPPPTFAPAPGRA